MSTEQQIQDTLSTLLIMVFNYVPFLIRSYIGTNHARTRYVCGLYSHLRDYILCVRGCLYITCDYISRMRGYYSRMRDSLFAYIHIGVRQDTHVYVQVVGYTGMGMRVQAGMQVGVYSHLFTRKVKGSIFCPI